jgi:hypothetical protein
MKKIFTILMLAVFVWGCAKKLSPAKPLTPPAANTGSVILNNSEVPGSLTANGTNNTAANSQPVFTTSETLGTKTVVKNGTQSPEVMSQIAGQATYNAKCGRCHQLKVTTDYTHDRWASILAVCANPSRANLNETERQNVQAYVWANSKN